MAANKDAISHRKRIERDKELIKLYAKGLTYREIASRLGDISYQGVHKRIEYLRYKGVNLPERNPSSDRMVEELNHFCAMI